MNCKLGDMAIVVSSYYGSKSPNLGKVVTCLKLRPAGYKDSHPDDGAQWEVDRLMAYGFDESSLLIGHDFFIADIYLSPLRGDLTNDDVDTQINREAETC